MRPSFRYRSRNASLRRFEDIGDCHALSPPIGIAWVVVGEHRLLAVALRAHMKFDFGGVVVFQVSRPIGTPRAALDSHMRPPTAKHLFSVATSSCTRVQVETADIATSLAETRNEQPRFGIILLRELERLMLQRIKHMLVHLRYSPE
jgi:hypothetical protein